MPELVALSFPSESNPVMDDIQDQLYRLKSSQNTSTSICSNLASLTDLHQGITNLIQMPSIQHALAKEEGESWMNELLEGSVRLVDLCAFSREVVSLTKESIQELESSMRRSREETVTADQINANMASRKNINKMVKKYIIKLKISNKNAEDGDLKAMLTETESLNFSVLKSVLAVVYGEKERSSRKSWSFLLKLTQTNRVHSEVVAEDLCSLNINNSQKNMSANDMLKQLNTSEMMIHELEEGLESLFRCLVKTRVSFLNALSH